MNRLSSKRTPKVNTLTQQQADFTAEGSPPPGNVATSVPVATTKETSPASVRGARKSPSSRRGR